MTFVKKSFKYTLILSLVMIMVSPLIIENVSKKLDAETKEQVMPLLEAILQAQPTVNMKSYQQTQITIAMPKSRYDGMGRPQVGNTINVDLKKI